MSTSLSERISSRSVGPTRASSLGPREARTSVTRFSRAYRESAVAISGPSNKTT